MWDFSVTNRHIYCDVIFQLQLHVICRYFVSVQVRSLHVIWYKFENNNIMYACAILVQNVKCITQSITCGKNWMRFFCNGGAGERQCLEKQLKRTVGCDVSWCFLRVEQEYPVSLKPKETNSGLSAKSNYHMRKQAERDLNPTPDAPLHLIKVERIDWVIWAALVHPCAFMHLRFTNLRVKNWWV